MRRLPRSLREWRIFIDTSAYFALLDPIDEHHAEAVAIVRQLAQQRYRHYTTNILLIEAHALLLSELGIDRAGQFIRAIRAGNTVIVRARASDEERAEQILFRYTDKDFSFADAISFAVMERLGIQLVFTFDHHFEQYGFTIVSTDLLARGL